MKNEKRNFDRDAALWDQNPGRVKVAADIAQAIIGEIKPDLTMDVLDFGCGTGLLTLVLKPLVHSIAGVDSSQGMLDVFRRKISDRGLPNISVQYLDLDRGDVLTGSYHLVVSSMTMHHIKNVDSLLRQFHQILRPAGRLCIADLDPEGGRFHLENDGVFHFGFDREEMKRRFEQAGFRDIRVTQAAQVEKPVEGGTVSLFTIFLITGYKG